LENIQNACGVKSSSFISVANVVLEYKNKVANGQIEDTADYGDGSSMTKEMLQNILTIMNSDIDLDLLINRAKSYFKIGRS